MKKTNMAELLGTILQNARSQLYTCQPYKRLTYVYHLRSYIKLDACEDYMKLSEADRLYINSMIGSFGAPNNEMIVSLQNYAIGYCEALISIVKHLCELAEQGKLDYYRWFEEYALSNNLIQKFEGLNFWNEMELENSYYTDIFGKSFFYNLNKYER